MAQLIGERRRRRFLALVAVCLIATGGLAACARDLSGAGPGTVGPSISTRTSPAGAPLKEPATAATGSSSSGAATPAPLDQRPTPSLPAATDTGDPLTGYFAQIDQLLNGVPGEIQQSDTARQSGE